MKSKQILIIGKPRSSKTTFLAQFYSSILSKKNSINLYKPVENITAIEDARKQLASGDETQATPPNNNVEILLPLKINEKKYDLIFPDYGGEQINKIVEERKVEKKWMESIKNSENWILFIRLNDITTHYDLSNKTLDEEAMKQSEEKNTQKLVVSDQSVFLELVQILLQIKGNKLLIKNSSVKLTIILTCWDELGTEKSPKENLIKSLPLFYDFIKANWEKDKFLVLGLSAQGFNLNNQEAKDKYLDEGPEKFAYMVNEEGKHINDISEIITRAL